MRIVKGMVDGRFYLLFKTESEAKVYLSTFSFVYEDGKRDDISLAGIMAGDRDHPYGFRVSVQTAEAFALGVASVYQSLQACEQGRLVLDRVEFCVQGFAL